MAPVRMTQTRAIGVEGPEERSSCKVPAGKVRTGIRRERHVPVAAGQPGVSGVARPCEEAQGATLSPRHLPPAALRVSVRTPVEVGTPRPTRERPHRVSFSKWRQGRPHPCPPATPSAASSIGLGPQTPCRKQESSGQPSRSPGSASVGRGCSWLYWKWRGRGEGSACLRANPRAPGWPRGLVGCPSPRQAAVHLQVPDPSCSCGQWPVRQGLGTGLLGRDPHPAGALTGSATAPSSLRWKPPPGCGIWQPRWPQPWPWPGASCCSSCGE